jgi:phosphatidate phosphatase LPIN
MQFVERVGRAIYTVSEFYRDINPSTLTGAIDVVVVEGEEKRLGCTPFHVRFGKLQIFRPQENIVNQRKDISNRTIVDNTLFS